MTKEEIMKGLECCQTTYMRKCDSCPYNFYKTKQISVKSCDSFLKADLLDLMKELLKEN